MESYRPFEQLVSPVSVKAGHGFQRQWRRNYVTRDLFMCMLFSPRIFAALCHWSTLLPKHRLLSNNRNGLKYRIYCMCTVIFSLDWTLGVSLMSLLSFIVICSSSFSHIFDIYVSILLSPSFLMLINWTTFPKDNPMTAIFVPVLPRCAVQHTSRPLLSQ